MRCLLSIALLAATLGWGCVAASPGADAASTGAGVASTGNASSGGTNAGSSGLTTTSGGPAGVALVVEPNPIDFGYVPITTTAVGCALVANPGNAAVEILSADDLKNDMGAFALSPVDDATPPNPAPVPVTIASGASAEVCFSFNPPVTQQYDGQATLGTSDGPGPVVQLTGWGGGPQVSCLPERIDFGQTLDHSPSVVPILCTNVGSLGPWPDLTIAIVPSVPGLSAWFDPPEPDGGFRSGLSDGGLESQLTIQVDLSYNPPSDCSDVNTKLIIGTSDGHGLEIPITGQALCLPCELAIAPPKLDFGNFAVGETSPVLTTSVQNVGSFPCDIDGIKIEGDPTDSFQIVSTSVQPDRDAGQIVLLASDAGAASSMLVQTSFTPRESGVFAGQLAVSIPNQYWPQVPLAGTSESTCLAVTPTSLDFGAVGGDAGQLQFSVSDQCANPAFLESINLQSGPGDSVPQYSTITGPTLPAFISPGAPLTYALSCAPTIPGAHPAQLILSDGNVDTLLWLTCSSP